MEKTEVARATKDQPRERGKRMDACKAIGNGGFVERRRIIGTGRPVIYVDSCFFIFVRMGRWMKVKEAR
ncbi:unnamed protein product [Enterobius vermicularis]|uniref:Non-specific serine/threonine protein kinase n=1 Tax=Enterobius vermicularis TaxID=51028 RepID=A0A0N4VPI7_ENTVE|nr:unnamed protein product [Enterobius vermicularis]